MNVETDIKIYYIFDTLKLNNLGHFQNSDVYHC